jgi:acetyltransferase-like isoleucine patch superfamily enzyme
MMTLKRFLKSVANGLAFLFAAPAGLVCWLEKQTGRGHVILFETLAHLFAFAPGPPGMYLRRAFYCLTLDACSLQSYIGFGAIFSQREVEVADDVYVGLYAVVGSSKIGQGSLIGSRASILSGGSLHSRNSLGKWQAFHWSRLKQVEIGANVWIGEAAVVLADIGSGSMIASGSVVSSPVPENVMVGGNPARFVRSLAPSTPQAVEA